MIDEFTFVDTNILLYAHDRSAGAKRAVAASAVAGLWGNRLGLLSTQVLQEFYVNATRKLPEPITASRARAVVERYATWPVYRIEPADVIDASRLEKRYRLSFWDSLIIVAAAHSGATRLLTEDLQHDREINGVRIENPFQAL
jgi:predicted nucleic acid-binding protein